MMTAEEQLLAMYRERIGQEIHVGPWLTIDQQRIDDFARVTGDVQWIHTDPQRAAIDSPYGGTIAHGYLTLSLLPYLTESNHPDFFKDNYPGMRLRVNYGLNRARFPAAVVCGATIRARTKVLGSEAVRDGVEIVYEMTVEIRGSDKPACVVEQVVRLYA